MTLLNKLSHVTIFRFTFPYHLLQHGASHRGADHLFAFARTEFGAECLNHLAPTLVKEGIDGLPGSHHSLISRNEPLRCASVYMGACVYGHGCVLPQNPRSCNWPSILADRGSSNFADHTVQKSPTLRELANHKCEARVYFLAVSIGRELRPKSLVSSGKGHLPWERETYATPTANARKAYPSSICGKKGVSL